MQLPRELIIENGGIAVLETKNGSFVNEAYGPDKTKGNEMELCIAWD